MPSYQFSMTKLYALFIISVGSLVNLSAFATDLSCAGIQLSLKKTLYEVNAGETVHIPLNLTVAHPDCNTDGDVRANFGGYNIPHSDSKSFNLSFAVTTNGKTSSIPSELTFGTTPAMSGDYQLEGIIGDRFEWIHILNQGAAVVRVNNSSSQIDLDGPVTTNVKMKNKFRIKETISLEVEVHDINPICVTSNDFQDCSHENDGRIGIICRFNQLGDCLDAADTLDTNGKVTKTGTNHYLITLDPSTLPQGEYFIQLVNFSDKWGNMARPFYKPIKFSVGD